MKLTVLCFSRDRPLQLEAYLRGLLQYSDEKPIVSVLYRAAPQYVGGYERLAGEYPLVRFEPESDLWAQTRLEVERCDSPLFMFGCDDIVIHERWSSREVAGWLAEDEGLVGVSLRLGTDIRYCHPLQRWVDPPAFTGTGPLRWRWLDAGGDWGVPFDMSATVYRIEWVRTIIGMIAAQGRRPPTPNFLESIGCKLARERSSVSPSLASYDRAVANCLTINRVQTDFEYPIYDEITPEELLIKLEDGWRIDVDRYSGRRYDRVHIGEVFLKRP